MIRTLRALVWLRWRLLYNGLRSGRKRGKLETISRAAEIVLPILLMLMLVPMAIGSGVLGFLSGWWLAQGVGPGGKETSLMAVMFLTRLALGAFLVMVVVLPLIRSVRGVGGSMSRLLLLPIPRAALHLGDLLSVFADPGIAVALPLTVSIAAGLVAGGRFVGALIALAAAVAIIAVCAAAGSITSSLLHLAFRNRRAAEWITLFATLGLSYSGLVWMFFVDGGQKNDGHIDVNLHGSGVLETPTWSAILPSELWARVVILAGSGRAAGALLSLLALCGVALAVLAVSGRLYARVLETPAISGGRRSGGAHGVRLWHIPGLSPAASAVAVTQVRTLLRTVRGRIAVWFLPLPMLAVGFMLRRDHPEFAESTAYASPGLLLAALGLPITFISLQMVHLNQFATDAAGLSLQFLAPISDRDLVLGKAAGGGFLVALALLLFGAVGLIAGPGPLGWMWICLPLAALSCWALYAPLAGFLSAVFPKTADLSRIGKGGNPHGLAGLFGFIAIPLGYLPAALIVLIAGMLLGMPLLAVGLLVLWCAAALGIGSLLLRVTAKALAERRETIALVAQGR